MNGTVIKGTPIAVDFWKLSQAPQARLFFLTHTHADHMVGLTRSWSFPIYTSETNAALLKHKFRFNDSVVKILDVGETYQLPLDTEEEYYLSVTPLDANHVPGAVMFLFQGYFGNYLYCGDMRWYPELLEHPVLHSIVESRELDSVFLDNTFSASYCDFPSREDAKKEIFNIIDSSPDSEIKIGVRNIGKECLLEAVALRYQERIWVTKEKFDMLKVLRAPDVFTTDAAQARIYAVPMHWITSKAHSEWNSKTSTVSIILTAMYVGWKNGPYSSSAAKGLYVVPYSDHSSYPELQEMVASLAPREVVPIVKSWSKFGWWSDSTAPNQSVKWDMSYYDHLLTKPPPDYFITPSAVEKAMKEGPCIRSFRNPEIRHCRLRQGLMPRPRRARTIPRGVLFCSPEPRTPSPTASVSIDNMSINSSVSTVTHTSHPWRYSAASQVGDHSTYESNLVRGSPVSPQCASCRKSVPIKDCGTQTEELEGNEKMVFEKPIRHSQSVKKCLFEKDSQRGVDGVENCINQIVENLEPPRKRTFKGNSEGNNEVQCNEKAIENPSQNSQDLLERVSEDISKDKDSLVETKGVQKQLSKSSDEGSIVCSKTVINNTGNSKHHHNQKSKETVVDASIQESKVTNVDTSVQKRGYTRSYHNANVLLDEIDEECKKGNVNVRFLIGRVMALDENLQTIASLLNKGL